MNRSLPRHLAAIVLMALAVAVGWQLGNVESAVAQQDPGAEVYDQHCASCHQPGGVGIIGAFPPLIGNPAALDPAFVEDIVRNGQSGPIESLGVSYDAVMPPVSALADDEVSLVVEYVVGLAAMEGSSTTETPEADAPTVGNADRGHDLFVGSNRFDSGGAACGACHAAGDVGNLGGASLGPDLDNTYNSFGGEAGLTNWLANPPSETMQPIFAERPLNEAELADVVAFLADAPNRQRSADSVDRLTLLSLAGFALLIGGMAIAWRGMRQTYVQRLRSRR